MLDQEKQIQRHTVKCDSFLYHWPQRIPNFAASFSQLTCQLRKFKKQLTGVAFPRKSRIQPENKFGTHGAKWSALHVDKGGVRRVRALDTPRLKVFVSKTLFGGNLHCVN